MLHSPPVKAAGSKKGAPQSFAARAPASTSIPFAMLFRMFVIGAVAVVASAYAIYRYYTVPRPPMFVPVTPSPSAAPAATELPAPELELLKSHP